VEMPWRIELFGWLRATHGDCVVTRFRTQKCGSLLAYLAYYRYRSHPRDALAELLWPDCDRDAGRHRLRMALSSLRHQLEPPGVPPGAVILTDRNCVQLNPAACTTDVTRFEAALAAAGRARSSTERVQHFCELVELYRGELLPGYFEDWVLLERQQLAEAFLEVLGRLIAHEEQRGDLAQALQWARRAVAADPLREAGHHELIRLLAAAGQGEAALRQYQELERMLARELGAVPDAATRSLARTLERAGTGVRARLARTHSSPGPSFPSPPLTGTVTFLLAEIDGERDLWDRRGDEFPAAIASYRELLRPLFSGHGGHEVPPVRPSGTPSPREAGSRLWVAFGRASAALTAAVAGQRALVAYPWPPSIGVFRVRMALHTGEVEPGDAPDRSPALSHAAQLLLVAHGGQILLSEKSAVLLRDGLAPGLQLVELGFYRLRDSAPPERLFQVQYPDMVPVAFPLPNALPGLMGNLPLQFTRFFGREREIARLFELLGGLCDRGTEDMARGARERSSGVPPSACSPCCRGESLPGAPRLVTLTGPGGSGKTRLALEVAQRLRQSLQGSVWFVSLVDLTAPHLILDKVQDALRLPRSPSLDPQEQVATFLSHQPSVLLLDNFEHLLPDGAAVVETLFEQVATLTMMVTSRRRLQVPGEHEFHVPPLPTPQGPQTPEQLCGCDSVRLFLDRAQAVRADFQVTARNAAAVAGVCERLEGIPLAIELAAARAWVLAPAQMLERLEQRFELLTRRQHRGDPRHRSLWATLDWSYQLLSPELRLFFARLSVFRGGWTLAAAEVVCEEPRALDCLEQLHECSLVETAEGAGEMRFWMLETLREYAREQLGPEELAALEQRAVGYYLALAEEAEPELRGPQGKMWLDRLEREHDNLRAAIHWSIEHGAGEEHVDRESGQRRRSGPGEAGLRLGGALWRFWGLRGYWAEGRERLVALLARADLSSRIAVRAKALNGAAYLAFDQGDYAGARVLLEESRRICIASGERPGLAEALNILGQVTREQGQYEAARALHEESLAILRELGDAWSIAHTLINLGYVAASQGDYRTPRVFLEESLAILRELGDTLGIAEALSALGQHAREQGDHRAAWACLAESLAIHREMDGRLGLAEALNELGVLAYYQRDDETARALCAESLAILRELGAKLAVAYSLYILAKVASCQGKYETARVLHQESLTIRREVGEKRGIAWSLTNLGMLSYLQEEYGAARALLLESLELWRELGIKVGLVEALEGLACLAGVHGQPERVARLLGATASIRETIERGQPKVKRPECARHLITARAILGEAAFAEAWSEGRAMTLDHTISDALKEQVNP
jgi:predicted ATPase/DNA-binding SARP family transcriptional activator